MVQMGTGRAPQDGNYPANYASVADAQRTAEYAAKAA